jgi:hypothetical protein
VLLSRDAIVAVFFACEVKEREKQRKTTLNRVLFLVQKACIRTDIIYTLQSKYAT